MVPRVRQVMRQTNARVFAGDTHAENKIVSLFEPSTEVIRKGKAGKPTEFGKMVKLQEAENQIVVAYEVYDRRPQCGIGHNAPEWRFRSASGQRIALDLGLRDHLYPPPADCDRPAIARRCGRLPASRRATRRSGKGRPEGAPPSPVSIASFTAPTTTTATPI